MPYIPKAQRPSIDAAVDSCHPGTAGGLTYMLTRICHKYLGERPNFLAFAVVVGCLVCTVLELYRRRIAPYETQKALENGDVYS